MSLGVNFTTGGDKSSDSGSATIKAGDLFLSRQAFAAKLTEQDRKHEKSVDAEDAIKHQPDSDSKPSASERKITAERSDAKQADSASSKNEAQPTTDLQLVDFHSDEDAKLALPSVGDAVETADAHSEFPLAEGEDSADFIDDLLLLDVAELEDEVKPIPEPVVDTRTEGFDVSFERFGSISNGVFSGPPEIVIPVPENQLSQSADKLDDVPDAVQHEIAAAPAEQPPAPEPISTFSSDAIDQFLDNKGGGNRESGWWVPE